jgi:signal peptidase I
MLPITVLVLVLMVAPGRGTVRRLQLWRDRDYTLSFRSPNDPDYGSPDVRLNDPDTWKPLTQLPVRTFPIAPGHYFMLGDNSPASSDSRIWGLVPERLLLGRTLLRYYPIDRMGW